MLKQIETKDELSQWIEENITLVTYGWYSLTNQKAVEFNGKVDFNNQLNENNTLFELYAYDETYSYVIHFYGDFHTAKKIEKASIKHSEPREYESDFGKVTLEQVYDEKEEDGVKILKPTHLLLTKGGSK